MYEYVEWIGTDLCSESEPKLLYAKFTYTYSLQIWKSSI